MADQSPRPAGFVPDPPQTSTGVPAGFVPDAKPPQSVMATIGEGVTDLGAGALKSIPETLLHLAKAITWLTQQQQVNPQIDAQIKRFEPHGAMQTIGGVAGDIAQAIIPQTGVEKVAGLAADAVPAVKGAQAVTRAVVRGVGNAGIAAAQGGDPTVAGVVGAAIPAIGEGIAPKLQSSAEDSMVEALGRSGGSGPVTRLQLKQAKQIAPDLLDQGFGGITNKAALAKSNQMLADAKQAVDAAWTGPLVDKDTSRIIDMLQLKRDRLTQLDVSTGARYVPKSSESTDELLATLQDEVKKATQPDGTADLRELRRIRQNWDDQVNYMQADPSKKGIAPIYRKAADMVRAQINGSDARIAQADADFSQASKLHDILSRTTERKDSVWKTAALHYGAPAVIGAGIGGYEGGYGGAAEGAAIGATLGKIITTPAFRYVSGNLKASLARALDSGDQTRIGMALTTIAGQLGSAIPGDKTPVADGTTATIGTPTDTRKADLQALQAATLRQYQTASGSDRVALGQKLQQIQHDLDAIK